MDRIIALNSGGFDSVVMLHEIEHQNPNSEIISLFFDYGQLNMEKERECARKVASDLGLEHIEIEIPKINWSNSSLYTSKGASLNEQYLEMRNVIFLSYALSLAESKGANSIAMAILKDGTYADTSLTYLENTREWLSSTFDIELYTPFADMDKYGVGYLARAFKVKEEDFFSCNVPVNGEPCKKCGDCETLDYIYKNIVPNTIPIHAWLQNDLNYSKEFEELFLKQPITEARLLINNSCQFTCNHCFYGFTESKVLKKEEFIKIIDKCAEYGIKNIHFSGKEPLVNEDIFTYMHHIRENYPKMTYDIVTNGLTLPKYIDKLVESKVHRICLSVDNLNDLTIRNFNTVDNVKLLLDNHINTTIFIDLHKNNYKECDKIIRYLYDLGVRDFFVRTVAPIGQGKSFTKIISVEELDVSLSLLMGLDDLDCEITFHWQNAYTESILKRDDLEICHILNELIDTANPWFTSNLNLIPEFLCGRYENTITITQDGNTLGCALEVGMKDYSKASAGDVLNGDLAEIIAKGKQSSIKMIRNRYKGRDKIPSCYHTKYTIEDYCKNQ